MDPYFRFFRNSGQTAALQEAVDKHAPLKASVCELPLVLCARLSLGLLPFVKAAPLLLFLGIQRGGRGFRCEARHKGGCQRFTNLYDESLL